ncbi:MULTISPECIES: fimbria/pilus periplasmic chaperone [unclassified Serratia (in: enterobacteria)]|uniref:fimbria/pilus periplasmic chaperone n=1 Tax=unclassified Serratia (in: enterobacteria) TaxID=2647522 RepID=UPI00046962BD|nr:MULTISPECIES: fimbria/pilus periplasmic chaperone [unclassified Serratia (in: enterobacteria)]
MRNLLLAVTASVLLAAPAVASIVITGTRVIYPSDAKEVSVKLNNAGKLPVLVQSWIDKGDANAKPESIKVPFILTPPINRVEASKGQTLRISYTGEALPTDKESVFWLNVLEIPAKSKVSTAENYLQMAFRSRIKFFYRPVGLQGDANEAAKAVTWTAKGNTLLANNPTPYFVSFVTLSASGKKIEGSMVAPYSNLTVKLSGHAGSKVSGEYVNDFGAIRNFDAIIK